VGGELLVVCCWLLSQPPTHYPQPAAHSF